jgi:Integrase core domain
MATDINQLWVADMTYIPTWQGFLYLAVVTDVYSQYTSVIFGKRCAEMGVRPSMGSVGSVGDAHDNAMAQSFFATLECELIDRRSWKTHTEARLAIFTRIEAWYNPKPRHSDLGQMSPIEFERRHEQSKQAAKDKAATNQPSADENGLPTGCCAPVHNPSLATLREPPGYAQASPVDKPAPECAAAPNCRKSIIANLVENNSEVKNL